MLRKYKEELEGSEDILAVEKPIEIKPKKRYIAVVGISLDKFGKRFKPGAEIPLEMLEDPDVAFDWLLSRRKAIKEIRS